MTFEFRGITFEFSQETLMLFVAAVVQAVLALASGIAAIVTAFREGLVEAEERP